MQNPNVLKRSAQTRLSKGKKECKILYGIESDKRQVEGAPKVVTEVHEYVCVSSATREGIVG